MVTRRRGKITAVRQADENHRVLQVTGGGSAYKRTPCPQCPWRKSEAGSFPAEAFRISAHTAYDAAMEMFACHMAGADTPTTCAGFLLRNADNNVGARLAAATGKVDFGQVSDDGAELWESYRAMAEANGVAPDDPVLARCRANGT